MILQGFDDSPHVMFSAGSRLSISSQFLQDHKIAASSPFDCLDMPRLQFKCWEMSQTHGICDRAILLKHCLSFVLSFFIIVCLMLFFLFGLQVDCRSHGRLHSALQQERLESFVFLAIINSQQRNVTLINDDQRCLLCQRRMSLSKGRTERSLVVRCCEQVGRDFNTYLEHPRAQRCSLLVVETLQESWCLSIFRQISP